MQASHNSIHMLCPIQNHMHTDTPSIKIHNKTFQTSSSYYACFHMFSSYHSADGTLTQTVLLPDVEGTSTKPVLHMMLMGLSPKRSYFRGADEALTQTVFFS